LATKKIKHLGQLFGVGLFAFPGRAIDARHVILGRQRRCRDDVLGFTALPGS